MAAETGLKYINTLIKIPAIYPQYWLSQAVVWKQNTIFSCCFFHVQEYSFTKSRCRESHTFHDCRQQNEKSCFSETHLKIYVDNLPSILRLMCAA